MVREVTKSEMVMQSTCGAYELLFWRCTEEGGEGSYTWKPESSASKLRDVCWATWTSVLGWPVQGIWPAVRLLQAPSPWFPRWDWGSLRTRDSNLCSVA